MSAPQHVWIATRELPYEWVCIEGVAADEQTAKAICEQLHQEWRPGLPMPLWRDLSYDEDRPTHEAKGVYETWGVLRQEVQTSTPSQS